MDEKRDKNQKVKRHFCRNKKFYIVGGVCLATGLMIGKTRINRGEAGKIVQKINQVAWKPENNQMIVNFVENSTPSKPLHLVGTNLFFNSISEAARETGHHISMISKNVNGHIPDVKGDIFQLLEPAT